MRLTAVIILSFYFFTLVAMQKDLTPLEEKFLESARNGNLESLNECLKMNVDVNVQDKLGQNALHCACIWQKYSIINRLLSIYTIEVNSTQQEGFTPLYSLCLMYILCREKPSLRNKLPSITQATEIIHALIAHGAKVDIPNKSEGTLLNFIAGFRKFPLSWFDILLSNGATNKPGIHEITPLIKGLYYCYKNLPLLLTINNLDMNDIIKAKKWDLNKIPHNEQPKNDIHYKNGIKILHAYYFSHQCLMKLLKKSGFNPQLPPELCKMISWHAAHEEYKEMRLKMKFEKEVLRMQNILL